MKAPKQNYLSNLSIIIILMAIILNSCIPQRKIKLVQKKIKNDTTETFVVKPRPKNTVQPFDNLYIRVISPDLVTSNMFNTESNISSRSNIDYNMISYTVNDSGYIDFPYVGLIKLKDLTVLEAKDTLQSELSKYISSATVIVKFVGKSLTIIGEVIRQGEYTIFDDNVNIFTAISMASGFTDYANRQNITIIREVAGKASYHNIDLTDSHILESEYYYLKPEDIVLVQPLKQKSYGFATFPYPLVLTGLTTVIALLTFMRTF
jgi:polysaccharide export outer membrane protein